MHRSLLIPGLILALACSEEEVTPVPGLSACDFSSATLEAPGDTLAVVNGQIIGTRHLEEYIRGRVAADELTPELRQELLGELIDDALMYQDAMRHGYDKHDKIRRSMVTLLRLDKNQSLADELDIPDADLRAWYQAHLSEYVIPEQVQVRRILIKVTPARNEESARADIERIHARLTENIGRFTRLARQNSEDAWRSKGGNMGLIEKSGRPGLDRDVVDRAFSQEVETLSAPFRTREGFNLLFIDTRLEETQQTFEQVKPEVLKSVRAVRTLELQEAYVQELKTGSAISIEQGTLDAFVPTG